MASPSSQRQTVLLLMGLPRAWRALPATSARDWRLSGCPVWETASQATALTTARSRGGKGRLASAPGLVVEGEQALGPASAPVADGVGVEADGAARLRVGEGGLVRKQQGQLGALAQVGSGGASADEQAGLLEELGRETRLESRGGTRPGCGSVGDDSPRGTPAPPPS